MRSLTALLLALFCWLQYNLWWGKNGVSDYLSLKDNVAVQSESNAHLRSRNEQMYAEIADLKKGNEAIEERARNELGLIKQGETFFRIINDKD